MKMRLWWTALLVLIALGGAGLAAAADRPHDPRSRPELTWRADHAAQPWIAALAAELKTVDGHVIDLSRSGRDVLGRLTGLDVDRMDEALVAGDRVGAELAVALARLLTVRDQAQVAVEEWRLGPSARSQFDQLVSAVESAQRVTPAWQELGAHARRVAGLIDSLLRHDGLVFGATSAGRNANWDDALSLLEQAMGPLGEATEIRNGLATRLNTDTLDDLLDRYRAYDAALAALYTYVRDTGLREGGAFEALGEDVDVAQAALPADTSAMRVIVAEAAGPPLTEALVAIERVRGEILEALAATETPQP